MRTLRDKYHYHGFHLYTMNDAAPVIQLLSQLAASKATPVPTTATA